MPQFNKVRDQIFPQCYERSTNLLNVLRTLISSEFSYSDSDSHELRRLLEDTLVGIPYDVPNLYPCDTAAATSSSAVSLERSLSLSFLVHAYVILPTLSKGEQSVLTLGYQIAGSGHQSMDSFEDIPELNAFYPNSIVSSLDSPVWDQLLNRIGDIVMIHLLRYYALFFHVGNFCYVQMSGKPMQQLLGKASAHIIMHRSSSLSSSSTLRTSSTRSSSICKVARMHLDPNSVLVDHKRILYSKSNRQNFHVSHLLQQVPETLAGAYALMMKVFSGDCKSNNIPKRLRTAASLFVRFIKNHRNFPYQPVLESTCPLPEAFKTTRFYSNNNGNDDNSSKSYTALTQRNPIQNSNSELSEISMKSEIDPSAASVLMTSWPPSPWRVSSMNTCISSSSSQLLVATADTSYSKPQGNIDNNLSSVEYDAVNTVKRKRRKRTWRRRRDAEFGEGGRYASDIASQLSLDMISTGEDDNRKTKRRRYHNKKPPPSVELDALTYEDLVSSYSSEAEVSHYLNTVLRKVVPIELWGSKRNRKQFCMRVIEFVKLGMHETMSLGTLVAGIKTNDFNNIFSTPKQVRRGNSCGAQDLLILKSYIQRWLLWLMNEFVVPLIKSAFYVTESSVYRYQLFFYRKPVWKKMRDLSINDLCHTGSSDSVEKNHVFSRLTKRELRSVTKNNYYLNLPSLRFVPKSSKCRPIVNLSRRPLGRATQSVNDRLEPVLRMLSFLKARDGYLLGSSVFCYDDIYARLTPFQESFKAQCKHACDRGETNPELYMVSVDVKGAFDSIAQLKLFEIVVRALPDVEVEYQLRSFWTILSAGGAIRKRYQREASKSDDFVSFIERAAARAPQMRNTVLVDAIFHKDHRQDALIELLRQHIFSNIVKVGNNGFRQIKGIPQGSCLSTLLCSYFYADLERTSLYPILNNNDSDSTASLLMRLTDDFFFMSTSLEQARMFLQVMHAGHSEYGCFLQPEKTLVNFDAAISGVPLCRVKDGWMPWVGLLLNCTTLDVAVDYSRYQNGRIVETFTRDVGSHIGFLFRESVLSSVKIKCHAILLDGSVISRDQVLINLYQICLMTAMKFHELVRTLPLRQRIDKNVNFFVKVVFDVFSFLYTLALGQLRKAAVTLHKSTTACSSLSSPVFNVTAVEVRWLGCHAFLSVLDGRRSLYRHILDAIHTSIYKATPSIQRGSMIDLQKAIQSEKSSIFNMFILT